jgi:hypothetical protein
MREGHSEPIRSSVSVSGYRYERLVVRTHWITGGEDLAAVLERYLAPLTRPGDWVIVSEKATVIASKRAVPADAVRLGRLAAFLASRVHPAEGSRGISVPEKMQFVVDRVGKVRVLAAAFVSAATRPFGIHGAFYVVAGRVARAIDGMRPPWDDLLLPPLNPRDALDIARGLEGRIGVPVAIVDINDRGGSIRAVSSPKVPRRRLGAILRDNPLGQRSEQTPIGIIRRAS